MMPMIGGLRTDHHPGNWHIKAGAAPSCCCHKPPRRDILQADILQRVPTRLHLQHMAACQANSSRHSPSTQKVGHLTFLNVLQPHPCTA